MVLADETIRCIPTFQHVIVGQTRGIGEQSHQGSATIGSDKLYCRIAEECITTLAKNVMKFEIDSVRYNIKSVGVQRSRQNAPGCEWKGTHNA